MQPVIVVNYICIFLEIDFAKMFLSMLVVSFLESFARGKNFFWVKWYMPSFSYTIYHTKASSFILKDNTLPCDSSYYLQIQGKAAGVSFRWTLRKKVCFNWYRLRLIKIIFWRKLAAVSDNNLFRIFLYTNIWKKIEYLL